jgi:hypothetical protein
MVVSKSNSNKHDKDNVLRAADIIPPYGNQEKLNQRQQKDKADDKKDSSVQKKRHLKDLISRNNKENLKPSEGHKDHRHDNDQQNESIPKFDLAEDIMTGQRKVSSARRRAPNKKIQSQGEQAHLQQNSYIACSPTPILSEQEQIISEIVANDIGELCSGRVVDTETQSIKTRSNNPKKA